MNNTATHTICHFLFIGSVFHASRKEKTKINEFPTIKELVKQAI